MDSAVRYAGQFTDTAARSRRHGDLARFNLEASLSPPTISVAIHDGRYDAIHTLSNTRYDFKARDSPRDLRARDTWSSDWVDCFRGTARLVYPRINSIPNQIDLLIFASWGPAFVVVEFEIGNDYCQFATRTRPGSLGRWIRSNPPSRGSPPRMPHAPPSLLISSEASSKESSAVSATIEAHSAASTADPNDSAGDTPSEPIHVNFARTDTTLNLGGR